MPDARRVHHADVPGGGRPQQRLPDGGRRAVLIPEAVLVGAQVNHVDSTGAPIQPRHEAPVAMVEVLPA